MTGANGAAGTTARHMPTSREMRQRRLSRVRALCVLAPAIANARRRASAPQARLRAFVGDEWKLRGDGRAVARRARDLQAPVERLDAVDEAAQAAAEGRVGATDAVVGDLDARVAVVAPDADAGPAGLRSTSRRWRAPRRRRSRPRVRSVPEGARADRRTRRSGPATRLARESSAVGRPCASTAVEETARELPQLGERRAELVAGGGDELFRGPVTADAGLEQSQLESDRHQPLLGAVVKVAFQSAALRVAGGDDPLARCLQLGQPRFGLREQTPVARRRPPSRPRPPRPARGRHPATRRTRMRRRCPTRATARPGPGSGSRPTTAPGSDRRAPAAAPLRGRRHASCPVRGTARPARRAPAAIAAVAVRNAIGHRGRSEQTAIQSSACERVPATRSFTSTVVRHSSPNAPPRLGRDARRRGGDAATSGPHDGDHRHAHTREQPPAGRYRWRAPHPRRGTRATGGRPDSRGRAPRPRVRVERRPPELPDAPAEAHTPPRAADRAPRWSRPLVSRVRISATNGNGPPVDGQDGAPC